MENRVLNVCNCNYNYSTRRVSQFAFGSQGFFIIICSHEENTEQRITPVNWIQIQQKPFLTTWKKISKTKYLSALHLLFADVHYHVAQTFGTVNSIDFQALYQEKNLNSVSQSQEKKIIC